MRLGIFGGTFDPPHVGHARAAKWVLENCRLERILLTPAWLPPHKPGRPLSSPFDRYAMTVLAALDEAGLQASSRELRRGGVSFAIETLRETRTDEPESRIFFVLGTDQFAEIGGWKEPEALVEEFELIVVGRPGTEFTESLRRMPEFIERAYEAGRILRADVEPVPVSSTEVRCKVRAGAAISGLVSPQVAQYIHQYGLYRHGG